MTEADDAQKKADEKLLALEKLDRVYDYFSGLGLDEATAMLLAKAEQDLFNWNSVRLTYGKNKVAALDASVAEHYKLTLPALFKAPEQKAADQIVGDVPADILAAALDGSMTAKSQVYLALKLDPKSQDGRAQLESYLDTKRLAHEAAIKKPEAKLSGVNPWSAEHWNITKQGAILKGLGPEKAASIARAAKSFIGATRPYKAA